MIQRTYRVVYTPQAKRQLAKIDNSVSRHIYSWIGERLDNSEDPRSLGRKLTGSLSGLIRYTVGDYRIIAQIIDNELVILVIEIEHRKKIYDRI